MHAEGDNEALAIVGHEAKSPRGSAVIHGESIFVVGHGPGSFGEDGHFSNVKVDVGVVLVDAGSDFVTHSIILR